MSSFSEAQIAALRDLKRVWRETPFSLVGAAGLTCQMTSFHRQTSDLDLAVAVSLDSLPLTLNQLDQWKARPGVEHQWLSPEGARVDIIPAGPSLLAEGSVTWGEGRKMSLKGFQHALSIVTPIPVASDVTINVATVPVIALLKVISYTEMPATRGRDLGDLAHILKYYIEETSDRRYSDEVFELGLTGEEVSGFLLGSDLAKFVNLEEGTVLDEFITRVESETDGGKAQAEMASQLAWRNHPNELLLAIRSMRRGLANSRA
jgi:predicted nucleotidyltransferase